jgi:predicted acyl esterase
MKKYLLLLIFFICQLTLVIAQQTRITSYSKKTYMIPMRDGTKLFTVVLSPTDNNTPLPFLIQRTPYGADLPIKEDLKFYIYLKSVLKKD